MLGRWISLAGTLLVCATLAGPASAGPNLFVGLSDDYLKSEPERAAPAIRDLGVSAVRLTLDWRPGQTALAPVDAVFLQNAVDAALGIRIVVAVYSDESNEAPQTDQARDEYCSYVRSILERYPQVSDVVIWNEPNKSTFWRPQFNGDGSSAAPAAYGALLARCYDVLHGFRPSVNVIHAGLSSTGNDRPDAASNISHSPGNFVRREGDFLRGSGRPGPLFDTFAIHPYGETASERPWKRHDGGSTIGIGDWDRLMQALFDGFAGTGQPLPGRGLAIWYLEIGYQTRTDGMKSALYQGGETEASPVADADPAADSGDGPAPDQATQLADAIRLAYCQPYVEAFFNFLLRDEQDLGRWQSGLLYPDWTAKPAYAELRQVIQEVRTRSVDCSALKGGPVRSFAPKTGVAIEQVVWPKARSFGPRNDLWRFRIQTGEPANYEAYLYRLDGSSRVKGKSRTPVLTTSGELKKLYFVFVKFPDRVLPPGRYAMEIVLTSLESSSRHSTLTSPSFDVAPRR